MKNLCSVSTLAALVIFFLPWVDLKCSGQSVMTQSGMQSVYGGFSPAEGAEESGPSSRSAGDKEESLGVAWFVGLAFVLVLLALFTLVGSTNDESNGMAGLMLGGALALVVIQMMVGFPIDKKIKDSNFNDLPFANMAQAASMEMMDPDADAGDLMAAQMLSGLDLSAKVEYMPPLYFELGALGIAMILAFTGSGGGRSRSRR